MGFDTVTVTCCSCGTDIVMQRAHYNNLKRNKGSFWCPAGHRQHFVGPTKAEREVERLKGVVRDKDRSIARLSERIDELREEADYHHCLYPYCDYRNKKKKRVREHMMKCEKRIARLPANAGPDARNAVVH